MCTLYLSVVARIVCTSGLNADEPHPERKLYERRQPAVHLPVRRAGKDDTHETPEPYFFSSRRDPRREVHVKKKRVRGHPVNFRKRPRSTIRTFYTNEETGRANYPFPEYHGYIPSLLSLTIMTLW